MSIAGRTVDSTLAGPSMYLELSRALIDYEVEFRSQPGLSSLEDIPIIVKINLKFLQFSCAVIFSISYLEAYINHALHDLINNRINLSSILNIDAKRRLQKAMDHLKKKYPNEEARNKLYRDEKLTKKLNTLYTAYGITKLSESGEAVDQRLWHNLIKLQELRNQFMHLKPNFIESDEFKEFFNSSEKDFKDRLRTPLLIVYKLNEDLPIEIPNLVKNSVLEKVILRYAGDAMFEHLTLTETLYTLENVRKYGTRWIHSSQNT